MKKIMFLGYSNLIKRRILPIIHQTGIDSVVIAKYEGQPWDDGYKNCQLSVERYDSYEDGISKFDGNIVYISTVNSTHAALAEQCLEKGWNVVIDKPATLTESDAVKLVGIAERKKLLLAESTVYLEHPQLKVIDDIFKKNDDVPKLLTVHFTMPPFTPDNFRYRKSLGGGAINDTAPYAVSISRYFFNDIPEKVAVSINESSNEVDIEYSLLMKYKNGKCMIGHFGFNTEYMNQVMVIGNRTNVEVNRIFTIPDDMENELTVRHKNETSIVKAPKGNTFSLYLKRICELLDKQDYRSEYEALLMDAKVRACIVKN